MEVRSTIARTAIRNALLDTLIQKQEKYYLIFREGATERGNMVTISTLIKMNMPKG